MASANNAPLDWKDIKNSAAKFSLRFKDAKKEESFKQTFWNEFFAMFGIDAIEVGMYEQFVRKFDNHTGEIDYFWPRKLIIEHKSAGKDLDQALNQAMDYILAIEDRKLWPRYIIVSDFKRIRLVDIVEHTDDTIMLSELVNNIEKFGFLAGYADKKIEGQHPVNVKAAEIMGKLYDLLKESNYPEEDLDTLLIRLVFCLFAEDADIFERNIFSYYLTLNTREDGSGMAGALDEIFSVLNTPIDARQKTMSTDLMNFPYVNGGLFEKQIKGPSFDREMRDCLFEASKLDWKYISPAIFGSLFQCIMDPAMRRELGAHYTSEENILKLINPLFMDDLRTEFEKVKKNKKELRKLWDKISAIRVMDPACGCGNFLIITYREMRRLEMDILDALYEGQMILDESHLFVDHYYGIEIGEFASMVASLSIILMDHLMNMEMRNRFGRCRDIIPLKEKANIICANSLTLDWSDVVSPSLLTYIVGNPPFVGASMMTAEQKKEAVSIFGNVKLSSSIDYVGAWYHKAAQYIDNTEIRCAFVSTNSICQGEQVGPLWNKLFNEYSIKIDFAYRTFVWNNEAKGKAAVHCIIVGFSKNNVVTNKFIVDEKGIKVKANNVSPYLIDAPNTAVESRSKPLFEGVPRVTKGNQPSDGGFLILSREEKDSIIGKYSEASKYIHPYVGSVEYINGGDRYCLWLTDDDRGWTSIPPVVERVNKVREFRLKSSAKPTRDKALTPHRFFSPTQPDTPFIVIPRVSSGDRKYIPMGIMDPSIIASDGVSIVHDSTLYELGILTSSVHMVWVSIIGGRLKSDYRYSGSVVYNTFPWPNVNDEQKKHIESLVQSILDIRQSHRGETLATLYNKQTMPEDLMRAHKKLDAAVEKLYSSKKFDSDLKVLEHLIVLYTEKIRSK